MARYTKRDFQLGDWWLGRRGESPAWYRCRYVPETGRTERFTLSTDDFEVARERLIAWFYDNRKLASDNAASEAVPLADVLLDYWNNHARGLGSHKSSKILLRYWNEFWGDASVAAVRSVAKQEEFQQFLLSKGLSIGTVNRVLSCGASAINRAWKRGAISSAPFIARLKDRREVIRGKPLSVDELRALWVASQHEHWRDMLALLIGTACRPAAARELEKRQIDFDAGLIRLNPEGREQSVKRRPVVKLPQTVRERFKDRPDGRLVLWKGEKVENNDRVMRLARKRAGLTKDVNLYSIRHTCARWMRMDGVPPDQIACQLGHKVPQWDMTSRYAPNAPDYLDKACASLDRLLRLVSAP